MASKGIDISLGKTYPVERLGRELWGFFLFYVKIFLTTVLFSGALFFFYASFYNASNGPLAQLFKACAAVVLAATFVSAIIALTLFLNPVSEAQRLPRPTARRETSSEDATSTAASKKTLAVLPFRNLSSDAASDFYAMSLADGLTTELATIGSVVVTPSSTVAKYRDQAIDPARVRAVLGVDVVLMGNFLKAGDRIRVTAQLMNTSSGAILWSEKIDADATDVLAIQDRILRRVVAGLSGVQTPLDPTHLLKNENEEIRLDAVRTLEFSHDPRALAALVEALRDPSLKVKAEAVEGVVRLGEQATGPVIRLLNDAIDESDNLTARYAAKALGLIGDRGISSVLVELLTSEDKFVAREAGLALGRLRDVKAVPDLIAMLDPSLRKRVLSALRNSKVVRFYSARGRSAE